MGTRPDPEARPSANSILGAQIGRVRVGRLPTAPSQQTIISALLRGARAAGWELGTAREGLLLHPYPWEWAVGILEAAHGDSRCQQLNGEIGRDRLRGVGGKVRGEGGWLAGGLCV